MESTITVEALAKKMKQKPSQVAIALLTYGIEVKGPSEQIPLDIANKLQGIDADIKSLKSADTTASNTAVQTGNQTEVEEPKALTLADCQLIAEVHEVSLQTVQNLDTILSSEEDALALAKGVYDAERRVALYNAGEMLVLTEDFNRRRDRNSALREKILNRRLDINSTLAEQGIDLQAVVEAQKLLEIQRLEKEQAILATSFDEEQTKQAVAILAPIGIDLELIFNGEIQESELAYTKAELELKKHGISLKTLITRTKVHRSKPSNMEGKHPLGLERLVSFSKVSTKYIKK
ncbi:hypothetical protein [Brasilonema sp. UFV-L1]|uniref:hypothetical protein n=1 Tax=Brasilonema sp. UFV-L1 TaxID=2234130 RepID=UPI00145F099A|nr:hypothetical protein [Brasilonema sp. UFV-L1]NMG11862.1 hypothetical protein [Brasilonema sp. UFV-L1]